MSIEQRKIKVWDFPTRLFHWAMVSLLGGLWWTADIGEMQWHQVLAYVLMTLIAFRLVWGFVGSDTAKFSHFFVSPKKVIQYATSQPKPSTIGHNPLGGYMVFALLGLLALQLTTGLFATDDIFTEGPLIHLVSSDTASWLTWLHKTNFNIILALAAIHVLAVIIHVVKGDNILKAMFSGYKQVEEHTAKPVLRSPWLALVIVAVIFGFIWWLLLEPVVSFL
ncbi:cytochrome b/b6 domain-containing protein [Shewanella ulleungensis]|uniref:Cytochrome b561 n=1 Tax=Shewanella ulleungensis TaxID=2282699 RepID=A0ABQ2QMQ6_9GAMM|nr:cytochrome b/b6 domain-containing protein [Shewanella ulleungensis]MCL1149928.1 cytochrome b/b6 domain-containing protein [Shewanella ulleungensis]GGP85596.1 cytochrome b561 [Shewanella ulleungensis]